MAWQRVRTEELISRLVADLRPHHVERRARARGFWTVAIGTIALPLLALARPLRADIASQIADPVFAASVTTSALIFVTGLLTVLIVRRPGRSRFWLLVPLAAFGSWLVMEFGNVAFEVFREGSRALAFESSPQCPLIIGIIGVPLFLAILSFSRLGLMVWRGPIVVVAALSSFSLPATILNLFHSIETSAMVLLWHLTAVVVFTIAAAFLFKRRIPRMLHDWLAL
ncbi:MAG: DUF1109 domain-containing protein [Bosea sp.]|uniref:NrsF family protein n=1 Tax=Bosea sp. (in: a-proteobacteria) TaxID=1871050 RepID=UPI0023A43FF7|nr:DUF1109 domain-containing protein [Bosea sp. (in: a-proteobacteria)]MCP4735813.1 DUF1109 domain-containing protein [Bosea sp. (in: a-proteobacteria)]